jgi:hypothetical protein
MCLGRIIRGIRGESYSLIKPTLLTKIFVAGDVLSLLVQAGAAGLMVTGDNFKKGEQMVIGGLMIQIVMFGLFAVTAVVFGYRVQRSPTSESRSSSNPWKKSMHMLYIVSILIMVRSVFRVIEYAMGSKGYLLQHEWTLYIFDSTLMFAVMVIYYFWYPTWVAPEKFEPQSFSV